MLFILSEWSYTIYSKADVAIIRNAIRLEHRGLSKHILVEICFSADLVSYPQFHELTHPDVTHTLSRNGYEPLRFLVLSPPLLHSKKALPPAIIVLIKQTNRQCEATPECKL